MKVILRKTEYYDLEYIYSLQKKCFRESEWWYRSLIQQYLDNGLVIQLKNSTELIGVLLQGQITPCDKKLNFDTNAEYKSDVFEPTNDTGKVFNPYQEYYGIVMICIHPEYRGKGLAQKLIEKHFEMNNNKILCLNTRRTNINAYQLYKKMGYEQIAFIKNKYFLPIEDSIFMIKLN
jgi:ribosomal protein S18 acetylase RimI-like enzyme